MKLFNAQNRLCRFLRNTWVLSLALSLSGALPVVHAAVDANNPFLLAESANQRASELNEQIEMLVRRAHHPDSPAAPGGVPRIEEVAHIEEDVIAWRTQIELILANPELIQTTYVGIVNSYMNVLTLLTTLRIALALPHGPSWSDTLALRIPKAVLANMPNIGAAPASNRLGDTLLPLIIDRGPNQEADPVQLKISASLLQGLELGSLADNPNKKNYLTMIQYMATRQLLQNLTDLRFLKRDHNVAIPEIPSPLRDKLESMGLASIIDQEQRRAFAEPGARAALAKKFEEVQEQFPPFVDAKFVTELSNILGSTAQQRKAIREPLFDELYEAEKANSSDNVKNELAESPEILSSLKTSELLSRLRGILSTAKAFTLLNKLKELKLNKSFGYLSTEQRESMIDILNERKTSYADSLTDAALHTWYNEAREASEISIYEGNRTPFTEMLMDRAPEVVKETQQSYSGDTVNLSLLSSLFSQELAQMSPRDSVKDWLFEITGAGSYLAARAKFASIVLSLTSKECVDGDAVNVIAVSNYLDQHDFKPDLIFSVDHNSALGQKTIERIIAGRIRDIRNLIEIGKWFGFYLDFFNGTPSVHDLLSTPEKVENYFKLLDHSVMTDHGILAIEVTTQDASSGDETTVRLADALTSLNPQHIGRQDLIERAQPWVDQALSQVETNIRKNIDLVARATDLAEIEKVVTSSMMLALVMRGFPEFKVEQQEFIRQLLEPSFSQQIANRTISKTITYGFGVLLLLHGAGKVTQYVAKDAAPYITLLGTGINSVFAGFMRAAMIGMAADSAFAIQEYFHSRTQNQQANDFYQSSAWGRSFLDGGEIAAANASYQMNSWMFAGRMAMDFGAMYFPVFKELVTTRGDAVLVREFAKDCKDFEKLGLEPGEFKALEGRIQAIRAARASEARSMSEQQYAESEKAFQRLSIRDQAGKSYALPNLLEELAKEDCFKTLNLPSNAKSFEKVDEAFARLKKTAFNPSKLKPLERARSFLKNYVQSHPDALKREFKPLSKSERRLVQAMGRKGLADQMWNP